MTEPMLVSPAQLAQAQKDALRVQRLIANIEFFKREAQKANKLATAATNLYSSGFDCGRAQAYSLAAEFLEETLK